MSTVAFLLTALLLGAGCASKERAAGRPPRDSVRHVGTARGEGRFSKIRDMIAACDRVNRPKILPGGKLLPPDRERVADECGGALEISEETAMHFPDDAEAAALVILAVSAAFDRQAVPQSREPAVQAKTYCGRSAPWFQERYRKTAAPEEAFRVHCPEQATRVYATAVENERSTSGVFMGLERGDTTRLLLRDDRDKTHVFWCLRGCAPFDADEAGNRGKRVKVFWVREKNQVPEAGRTIEMQVFLRATL